MNNNENKKKSEIVYKTVEETIVVTEEDVDVKWIQAVNDSMREDANYARKERYHCYRLDIADDKDEWVASHEHDPFYNLCRETPEEELNRLYYAISQLNEDQQRLIDYKSSRSTSKRHIQIGIYGRQDHGYNPNLL